VRDQPVERGVIEPNGLGLVLARRVPGQLLERRAADRDVQPEHARIGPILDGLRRAGSTDALHRAVEERNATLTAQARALLEAASHLHALVAGASK
jgi:hypothetical protein